MPFFLEFHWRRLRARLHRARLALHARGWRGLLARLRPQPTPAVAEAAAPDTPDTLVDRHDRRDQAAPGHGLRILVVDVTTPRPDRDSGSVRAVAILRLLVRDGHAVDFLPDDRRDAGSYRRELEHAGVRVLHAAPAYPALLRDSDYHWVIVSRYHLAYFLTPLVRRLAPRAGVVLDTVDLHHLREAREARLRGDATLARLSARTRRHELQAAREADATWVVSPHEAALLGAELPGGHVFVVPNIHEVPPMPPACDARAGLLFVGGGQHPPNLDAVRWLVGEIFPLIRARLPGCRLHLVGDGLEAAIAGGDAIPGIHLHGHVPDLAPLLARTRVGLAPLRFGAGVKGKVNQYMAAGLAVVSTPCGAEGMHLTDGVDVLVRERAADFAEAVVAAHQDDALWHRLSTAGHANIARHFSPEAARVGVAATLDLLRP